MTTSPRKVLLIDSSAVLHRCYHGYPHDNYQSTIDGEPIVVNALHGYLQYILRVQQDFAFDDLIHVLDPQGGSVYRKNLYPDYKGQRPPTEPELQMQKDIFIDVLSAFAQRFVQIPGVESDDVLATLAKRHADRGDLVVVLSPDKDLLQLVEDGRVAVARYVDAPPSKYDTFKRKQHEFFDEAAVIAKLGVHPRQVADYLAIMGDVSDNLIGVEKAGPKTAAKWLAQYGDLETLITHADSIKGVVGDNLRKVRDLLPTMKLLTRTLDDVDVPEISTLVPVFDAEFNAQGRQIVMAPEHWPHDLVMVFDEAPAPVATAQTTTRVSTAPAQVNGQPAVAVNVERTTVETVSAVVPADEPVALARVASEPPQPPVRRSPFPRPGQR